MPTQIHAPVRPQATPAERAVLAGLLTEGEAAVSAAPVHQPEAIGLLLLLLLLSPKPPKDRS
ncbi:hypothetical protein F4556_001283 [Kitasatospora gansuensis]|uniref:Uncharacterized protein n=1 Tax=Kitasatospora gansuensis TaxID=258050 RepID=A0A7W7WG92_9ACTN|nr:hypothetical protein [Kitasatospora gansuensis]MBB4945748.1 hypothetical protein [Kitasatospora gansuensis]